MNFRVYFEKQKERIGTERDQVMYRYGWRVNEFGLFRPTKEEGDE